MPIVVGGLGLPEEGALVAAGLGAAGAATDSLRARLAGSSDVTATLTDGAAPTPAPPAGAPGLGGWVLPIPYRRPTHPAPIAAHLHGAGGLTASIDLALDPEWLAHELAVALLLDLV